MVLACVVVPATLGPRRRGVIDDIKSFIRPRALFSRWADQGETATSCVVSGDESDAKKASFRV